MSVSPADAPDWVLAAIGIGALLVFAPGLRLIGDTLDTAVHEAGHALVALLTGQPVIAWQIVAGRGGCTLVVPGGPLASTAAGVAGYTAPPAAGLALLAALRQGIDPRTILLVLLAIPVLLLVFAISGFTVVVVVITLAVLALLLHRAGPVSQATAIVIAAVILLVAGLRSALALVRFEGGTDAHHLAEVTGLPTVVWIVAFAGFAAWALFIGGRWLLTQPLPLPG